MKTIDLLKKVRSAAAKKDLVPLQACFHFYDGRVQAQNGALCIDAPCDLFAETVTVNAAKFWSAANLTKCEFNYNITKAGKLSISKNKFRALIPTLTDSHYPRVEIGRGETLQVSGLLETVQRLRPFVSEDVSRPWSRAILFRDAHAYATNNVCLARLPAPGFRETSVPVLAIDTLLDLDMEPQSVTVSDKEMVFHLPGDMKLIARLSSVPWPDVSKIIKRTETEDLPEYFAETIENIMPFCDDPKFPMIILGEHGVATSAGVSEASVDVGEFPESLFRAEPLLLVARNAYAVDFTTYPAPCYFEGEDDLEGMIIGLRK